MRACQICAAHLPNKPRPIVVVRKTARLLIIGQAPGRKVYAIGIPWNNPGGDCLQQWHQRLLGRVNN
ncbi:MAG: hypothetical protein COC05_07535 [Gammaproteobacteria bacterium]|nr:MAG: hypothetical protein COC05_07535 [Gammaproteobacteria bacterium]